MQCSKSACGNYYTLIIDHNEGFKIVSETAGFTTSVVNLPENKYRSSSRPSLFIEGVGLLTAPFSDSVVSVLDFKSFECIRKFPTYHTSDISCFLLLPNGYFATGSFDGSCKIWNINNFECVNSIKGVGKCLMSLIFLKDYRIMSVCKYGKAMLNS
jgi:WD40 repeat protein